VILPSYEVDESREVVRRGGVGGLGAAQVLYDLTG
jgi:hypothetical protein